MSVASFIKSRRAGVGLTQQALSDQTGISPSTLKRYEGGKATPTLGHAAKLARTLRFNPSELFSEVLAEVEGVSPDEAFPTDSDMPDNLAEAVEAVRALEIFAQERGLKAPRIGGAIRRAEKALADVPTVDDLFTVADVVGAQVEPPTGLDDDPANDDQAGAEDGEQDDQDDAAARSDMTIRGSLIAQIVAAALYADGLATLDAKALEALAYDVADRQGTRFLIFTYGVPLPDFAEDGSDYEVRARRDLAPMLVKLVADRRPVPAPLNRAEKPKTGKRKAKPEA
jgi:transcriptional regulator with XRE-family HTH domain